MTYEAEKNAIVYPVKREKSLLRQKSDEKERMPYLNSCVLVSRFWDYKCIATYSYVIFTYARNIITTYKCSEHRVSET
jgi:hypothetical protein